MEVRCGGMRGGDSSIRLSEIGELYGTWHGRSTRVFRYELPTIKAFSSSRNGASLPVENAEINA